MGTDQKVHLIDNCDSEVMAAEGLWVTKTRR